MQNLSTQTLSPDRALNVNRRMLSQFKKTVFDSFEPDNTTYSPQLHFVGSNVDNIVLVVALGYPIQYKHNYSSCVTAYEDISRQISAIETSDSSNARIRNTMRVTYDGKRCCRIVYIVQNPVHSVVATLDYCENDWETRLERVVHELYRSEGIFTGAHSVPRYLQGQLPIFQEVFVPDRNTEEIATYSWAEDHESYQQGGSSDESPEQVLHPQGGKHKVSCDDPKFVRPTIRLDGDDCVILGTFEDRIVPKDYSSSRKFGKRDDRRRTRSEDLQLEYKRLTAVRRLKSERYKPQMAFPGFKMHVEHEIGDSVHDFVDDITKLITEMTKKAMDQVGSVKQEAGQAITSSWKQFVDWSSYIPVFIIIIFLGYKTLTARNRSKWALAFAMVSGFAYRILEAGGLEGISDIMSKFAGIFGASCAIAYDRPQSIAQEDLNPVASLAFHLISFVILKRAPKEKRVEKFLQHIGGFQKAQEGMSACITSIVSLTERATNYVRSNMLGYGPLRLIQSGFPEVEAWCDKVDKLLELSHAGQLPVNYDNGERIFRLVMEGNRLSVQKLPGFETNRVRLALQTYQMALKHLAERFHAANIKECGPRMAPLMILLQGKSGVGKTWATLPIINDLLMKILPTEQIDAFKRNYMDFVYNRQFEHVYWDKYQGQFCTIYDDFGQCRDVPGVPDNEYMEMIRIKNIFPYILHMASIGEKGATVFRSEVVVATTNAMNIAPNAIIETEAVLRRFDVVAEVVPKREYSKNNEQQRSSRRLDTSKVDGLNTDVYEFILKRYCGGDRFEEVAHYDYDQFLSCLVSRFKACKKESNMYLDALAGRMDSDTMADFLKPQSGHSEIHMNPISATDYDYLDETLEFLKKYDSEVGEDDFRSLSLKDLKVLTATKANGYGPNADSGYCNFLSSIVHGPKSDEVEHVLQYIFREAERSYIQCNPSSVLWGLSVDAPVAFAEAYEIGKGGLLQFVNYMQQTPRWSSRCVSAMSQEYRSDPSWFPKLKRSRNVFKELMSDAQSCLAEIDKKYSWLKYVGMTLGTLGVMFGMYKAFSNWNKVDDVDLSDDAESANPRGRGDKAISERRVGKGRTVIRNTVLRPEGGYDSNADDQMTKVMYKSQYHIILPSDESCIGFVTFIKGDVAIVPYHFILALQSLDKEGVIDDDTLIFYNHLTDTSINVNINCFSTENVRRTPFLMDQDLAMIRIPHAHAHPDISHLWVSERLLKRNLDYTVALFYSDEKGCHINYSRAEECRNRRVSERYNGVIEDWTILQGFKYHLYTRMGDCGSILCLYNKHVGPGKLLGIHVAGGEQGLGIASLLTKEAIEEALELFGEIVSAPDEVNFSPQAMAVPFKRPDNTMGFVPLMRASKRVVQPSQSRIIPSEMANSVTQITKMPAKLGPFKLNGEIIDPRMGAIERYSAKKTNIDMHTLEICAQFFSSYINNYKPTGYAPKLLSMEQAAKGDPYLSHCESIPRDTSAGYPYVLAPVKDYVGKEWFFGKESDYDLTRPASQCLFSEADEIIQDAKKGKRRFHVCVDFLKDELRSIDKAKQGNTRLISGAPVALILACRVMFMEWVMFMMKNNLNVKIGVGINPYSEDWHIMFKMLQAKGNEGFAGDYTNFDGSGTKPIFMLVCQIINDFYDDGEENARVRRVLFHDLFNSIHICGELIYQWLGGMPSGHFLTTLVNCVVNILCMLYCYCKLHPKGELAIDGVFDHIEIFVFGDDNILSVEESSRSWFNQVTVASVMPQLGMTYTDEDKTAIMVSVRPLTTLSFLKRGFRFEHTVGRYVAPLAMRSLLEMLNWTKRGASPHKISCDNVDTALMELSLHGEDDYKLWSDKIIEASKLKLKYHPPIVSWRLLLKKALSYETIW